MNNAEKNYQIIRQLEDGRSFMLEMYAQNPVLLKAADYRIRELFEFKKLAETMPLSKQRGSSLIELIMFIVIISVALAGILLVMNTTSKGSVDPLIRKQALAAAYSLLEEIELQDFSSASGVTTAVTQANRASAYHLVQDYNAFNTASVFALSDAASATPLLANYAVQVAVTNAAFGGIAAASAVQIDVTVTAPNGEAIIATGYRAAY
jgi:MSHA pilin protein MshD